MNFASDLVIFIKILVKIENKVTLESFFQKPYDDLESFFENAMTWVGKLFHENGIWQLIYSFMLVRLTMIIEEEEKLFNNYQSKANAHRIIKFIQKKALAAFTPLILSFFKWDFNRRVWGSHRSDLKYKRDFIIKSINEIENELAGISETTASKYSSLFLEFLEEYLNKISSTIEKETQTVQQNTYYKLRCQIDEMLKKEEVRIFSDENSETEFLNQILKKSKLIKEGLINFYQPSDFISNAFVFGLIEYKIFLEEILASLENTNEAELTKIKAALFLGDFEEFISILKSLFASIPYILVKNTNEAYYHIYTWLIVYLSGCEVVPEDWTNIGRIDLTIKTDEIIYLLEFKIDKTGQALKQIEDKNYYEKYLTANRRIIYAGITFDKKSGNIKEYEYKELQ